MASRSDARERMIRSAAELLPAFGIRGTSFSRVIEHSGAPRGSVGHHFPGGKDEMIHAAIGVAGDRITGRLRALTEQGLDRQEIVAALCDYFAEALRRSDFRGGCPIAAAAFDEDLSDDMRATAIGVIDGWIDLLAGIGAAGAPSPDDRRDAENAIHAVEGALIMCKLRRSVEPLACVKTGLRTADARP